METTNTETPRPQSSEKETVTLEQVKDMIQELLTLQGENTLTKRYQSLSIDVPWICPNACKYCVSAMHSEDLWETVNGKKSYEKFRQSYIDRMSWVKDEWTDTLMLTGWLSDPIVNSSFLKFIGSVNKELWDKAFKKVEIQTSGILIDDEKLQLLEDIWVKTIAFSLSSLDNEENSEISWIKKNIRFDINTLCRKIKDKGFNLRLCFNLSDSYDKFFGDGSEKEILNFFENCEAMWADQITFRELYMSGESVIDKWIKGHEFDKSLLKKIQQYIKTHGKTITKLPFWQLLYSINNKISTVIDDDCMDTKNISGTQKFSIIRPNGKLYSHWDDEWTLIF